MWNIRKVIKLKDMKLRTIAAVKKNNTIYFSPMYLNGVFSLDLEHENNVKCLGVFKEEDDEKQLYRRAYACDSYIWFVPENATHVARISIETNEIKVYKYGFHKQSKNGMFKYSDSFVIENRYLCLVPGNTDEVVIVDMETGKEKIIYDVVNPENESYVAGTYTNGAIWLCPFDGDNLIKINIENEHSERYKWGYGNEAYDGVCAVNNVLYFAPHKENVLLSINTDNLEESTLDISDMKCGDEKFQGIFKINDELWCMPFSAKFFLKYNLKSHKIIKCLENDNRIFQNWEWTTNNFMPVTLQNGFMLASCFIDGILVYDVEDDKFDNIEIDISEYNLQEYYKKCLECGLLEKQFKSYAVDEKAGLLDFLCENINSIY